MRATDKFERPTISATPPWRSDEVACILAVPEPRARRKADYTQRKREVHIRLDSKRDAFPSRLEGALILTLSVHPLLWHAHKI